MAASTILSTNSGRTAENGMSKVNLKKERLKRQLKFAANIMKRLPGVKVQGYRQFWPQIIHSEEERVYWEAEEYRKLPTKVEIDLMEKILEYYKPLEPFETKLVWQRAEGKTWKCLSADLGYSRASLASKYDTAISKMLIFIGFK